MDSLECALGAADANGGSLCDEDLGVIKAYCNRCLTGLAKKENKLVCPNCGSTETRKTSTAYGLGVV